MAHNQFNGKASCYSGAIMLFCIITSIILKAVFIERGLIIMQNIRRIKNVKFSTLIVFSLLLAGVFSVFEPPAEAAPFSGGAGTAGDPYIITTAAELDDIRNYLFYHFKLNNDIDLTEYLDPGGAGFAKWGAEGWLPIGANNGIPFIGSFDGNGHMITGLWINQPDMDYVGLFGRSWTEIKNLGVKIASAGVNGRDFVGGLLGYMVSCNITNSFATGDISGRRNVGGLVGGYQDHSRITNSYATGAVSGDQYVGGLVGYHNRSSIENSYATGAVSGISSVGGLAGYQDRSSITNSYAKGAVTGDGDYIGGLVGLVEYVSEGSSLANCYATGDVSSSGNYVGGLVGYVYLAGSIENCFTTGNIIGINNVGGLLGGYYLNERITNSYRYQFATINGVVSTENDPNGIHGGIVTVDQLITQTTYTSNRWIFSSTDWHWDSNFRYPKLGFGPEEFPFTGMIKPIATPASSMIAFGETVTIRLESPYPGATIRYTSDGSEPSENNGVVYTLPISITEPTTIKAKAFVSGMEQSSTVEFTYTVKLNKPTSTASLKDGAIFLAIVEDGEEHTVPFETQVSLSSTPAPIGVAVRYTIDNSEPHETNGAVYATPIVIIGPTPIKAKAYRDGYEASDTVYFFYDNKTLDPKAEPRSGAFLVDGDTISLTCNTGGATIRYTTNGSDPTESDNEYVSPIQISGTPGAEIIIKAKAFKDGEIPSNTVPFEYTIARRVATPTASPLTNNSSPTTINGNQRVTLSSESGAMIKYTTNGAEPSLSSGTVYTAPIIISGARETTTIKARAFKDGLSPSEMLEAVYKVGTPETKQFDPGLNGIVKVPQGVPFIGGHNINLDLKDYFPAVIRYDDGKIEVMIGYDFVKLNKDKPFDQYNIKEIFKDIKKDWLDYKDAWNTSKSKGWLYTQPSKEPFLKKMHVKAIVGGYFEGVLPINGNSASLSGQLLVEISAFYKDEWQTFIWFIPVVWGFSVGTEIEARLGGIWEYPQWKAKWDGLIKWVVPEIELHGGVGIKKLVSVGGFGNAKLNIFIWDPNEKGLYAVFEGALGGYARVLFFEYKWTPVKGTIWDSRGKASSLSAFSTANIYDTNNYSIAQRNYLESQSTWLGNQSMRMFSTIGTEPIINGVNILQESIYPDTAPLIAEANGKRVMVFLADDGSRDDFNRTKLMYSLYDSDMNTWSEPQAVNDNGTADFYPSIAGDGNDIWVTWHRSKSVFGSNISFDEMSDEEKAELLMDMLSASEIAVARFDNSTESFIDYRVLTDNDILNTQPVIAVNGNDAVVAWVQNTENDIFGTVGFNSSLIARQFSNGVWSQPVTLVSGLGTVLDMDAAFYDGKFQVAYITDGDNNFETIDDRSLTIMDLSKAGIRTPVSGKFVSRPQFVKINGEQVLSWLEEESVRYMTPNGQIVTLTDNAGITTDNYKIFNNSTDDIAVVYPIIEDGIGYFMARLYKDGKLDNPFKLAKTGDYARLFDGFMDDNGEFNVLFNNSNISIIGEDGEEELIEKNNLCSLRATPMVNITLKNVVYIDRDIRLGQPLPVDLEIENIGGVHVHSVEVKVNESSIGTFSFPGGLKTGETATVEFPLNIPANMAEQTEFLICVEPCDLIDADMSDNSRVVTLGKSNLMLLLEKEYNDDDIVTVVAKIKNKSDYDVNAKLLVRADSISEDIINIVNLGKIIGWGEVSTELTFDPKKLVPAGKEYEVLHFELNNDKTSDSDFVLIYAVEEVLDIRPTSVMGTVKSYHPDIPTTIKLLQKDDVKYSTTIAPMGGEGQYTQVFVFRDVQPGEYTLEITKDFHSSYIYPSLEVIEADIMFGEVELIPLESITITTQPAPDTTVIEGSISGSLSVTASSTQGAALSYQWYSNDMPNNSGGAVIEGATKESFTIDATLTAGTYYYYCLVSAAGAVPVTTNVATVTVNPAIPTVTSVNISLSNVSVNKGFTQAFYATVNGTNNPPQTVTWTVEGGVAGTSITQSGMLTVAAGETAAELTVEARSTYDNTKYGTATVMVTLDPNNHATINGMEIGLAGNASGEGWSWDASSKTLSIAGDLDIGEIGFVTNDNITIAMTGDSTTARSIVNTGNGNLTITCDLGSSLTLNATNGQAISAKGDIEINSGNVYASTTTENASAIESVNGSVTISGTASVTAETISGEGSAISAAENINISTSRNLKATANAGYSLEATAINITNGTTELFFNEGNGGDAYNATPVFSGDETKVFANEIQIYPYVAPSVVEFVRLVRADLSTTPPTYTEIQNDIIGSASNFTLTTVGTTIINANQLSNRNAVEVMIDGLTGQTVYIAPVNNQGVEGAKVQMREILSGSGIYAPVPLVSYSWNASALFIPTYALRFYTDNTLIGTLNVTVVLTTDSEPVTGVTIYPKTASITVYGTATLTATVLPDNATNKAVTWDSSNEAVAKVTNGVVTGVSTGTATITVTTVDGNFTDTCEVTVTDSEDNPPGISGPVYMELNSGYATTASSMFSITGTEPVTVTKTSGHDNITWDNENKRLNIAAGLAPGSYPVVLTANNGITPNATHTFTLTVINVPSGSSKLYFTPEFITAGLDRTFTITFNVDSPQSYNQVECVLAYDPELLALEAVTQIPPSTDWLLFSNTGWGTASFALVPMLGSSAMLSGNNAITTLRFKALRETSGTDISIIQLNGNGAGSSKLQHQVGGITENIPFTTQGCIVTVVDGAATLKASFQGRVIQGAANIENLMVKWISGDVVIAEETVTTDHNGEAGIIIPSKNPGLIIWVKGERMLAVSQNVGTVENGSIIDVGILSGGDSNGDNMVDLNDFNNFLINYGSNSSSPGFNRFADFNNDGVVDLNDFNIFLNNYGKTGAQLPAGNLLTAMSMMSEINEESAEASVNNSDSDGGCNAGWGFAAFALLALILFRKRQGACLWLKKILCVLLTVFSICAISATGFAVEHTMMISTDKDVYEVGEKFSVSVMVTLANDETMFSLSSVISFDQTALSVDNGGLAVSQALRPIEMLMLPLPLDSHQNLIGGAVSIINFASPDPVIIANTYLTFSAEFEAVTPGTYELILPEDASYPGVNTSFLVKRGSIGNPPPLLLVPSTKINKTITIIPPM